MEVNKVFLLFCMINFQKSRETKTQFLFSIFSGRRLSSQGRRDMDRIAAQMVALTKAPQ